MELDFGKFALGGAGMLVGAIGGAYIWAHHAASQVQQRATAGSEDDALIEMARHAGTHSLGAALQGAFVGAIIGLIVVAAYLYFTDPDRGMHLEKVDTGDDRY